MRSTFVIEELDAATRGYLAAARDRGGKGMPGVFVPGSNALPVLGLVFGPVIACGVFTWTVASNQILHDPTAVAFLQTAALVVGGWMTVAAFRTWAARRSGANAGHWTYADPLHLYEATGERITVTDTAAVTEATAVHNISNGSYTNTAVALKFPAGPPYKLTLGNQPRAENLVLFYNYLAWARGPEGGGRANLPANVLGGLAVHVAKHDNEPVDPDGNLDFNLLRLDDVPVPETPEKIGHARPRVLGYLLTVVAGVVCFFAMRSANVPLRDDALFNVVRENNTPPNLRAYLVDPRNVRHRDDVLRLLADHYRRPIDGVRQSATDDKLRRGMVRLLEGLKTADAPVVSVRVAEARSPAGKGANAADRAAKLRDRFGQKAAMTLGSDLIAFVEAPQGLNPHVDIAYEFAPEPNTKDVYRLRAKVTVRESVDEPAEEAVVSTVAYPTAVSGPGADGFVEPFSDTLIAAMIGRPSGRIVAPPPPPETD